jgi:hypothetical protein
VVPKVLEGKEEGSSDNGGDLLPLGYQALPRSASTVRKTRRSGLDVKYVHIALSLCLTTSLLYENSVVIT